MPEASGYCVNNEEIDRAAVMSFAPGERLRCTINRRQAVKSGKKILVILIVLACLQGAVVPVCAAEKTQEEQEYTDTLLPDCVLAVRADVFEGFSGTVEVFILDEYGKLAECELTTQNGYACNIQTAQGSYEVRGVSAYEGDTFYEVKRLESGIRVKAGEISVCRLVVSDYELSKEEKSDTQIIEDKKQLKEDTMEKQYENVQENTVKRKTGSGRISVLLWLAALTGAGIYWYLRYGRKKRYVR